MMESPVGLICSDNGQEVALKDISVNVVIGHMISNVESTLLYKNTRPDAVETIFKFPLDEGSAVYKMEAEIDGKVIVAECQEKQQAQQTYDTAKAQGMTAFLLREDDNSGDIFMCSLGNLPSQKEAKLTVAYVTELSRETDRSVMFTLPTVLNPRYHGNMGNAGFGTGFGGFGSQSVFGRPNQPGHITESGKGDYSFTLNVDIQSQFRIAKVTSETPEVSTEIFEPDRQTAKASFSSEKFNISTDLSFNIQYENDNEPTAMIERGSSGQDGIMKSDMLLLNFFPELEESCRKSGEFIFVIDRSGSMAGSNILNAKQTLMLLVKSLRVGFYFNIVSFGSNYHKLFPFQSEKYSKETMATAMNLINTMNADMGGTDLCDPLQDIFLAPSMPDHPRQIFVITDGAINNVNQALELVKKNSKKSRVFAVGIGQGASTALVKGLARAGNGRYDFVYSGDRLQQKVMLLMKFSMQPEVKNLSLEWTLSPTVSATTIPEKLPTLFVGEMVTLYALITGAERHEIVVGTIKMTGQIGEDPFEYVLEFEGQGHIDDTTVAAPIHRLAAKALVKDLEIEEMSGKAESKKAEIVLISVAANIVSKYTSFVGVDKDSKVPIPKLIEPDVSEPNHGRFTFGCAPVARSAVFGSKPVNAYFCSAPPPPPPSGAGFGGSSLFGGGGGLFGAGTASLKCATSAPPPPPPPPMGGFGSASQQPTCTPLFGGFGSTPQPHQATFGSAPPPPPPPMGWFGSAPQSSQAAFGSAPPAPPPPSMGVFRSAVGGFGMPSSQSSGMSHDDVIDVISLQGFDGSWEVSDHLKNILKITEESMSPPEGIDQTCWMTCVVLVWLEHKQIDRKDEWELIYQKAHDWLNSEIGSESLNSLKTLALSKISQP